YAARRLVDDDDLGVAFHRLAQHQLLLVAARKLSDPDRSVARPYIEAARGAFHGLDFAGLVEKAAANVPVEGEKREIGLQANIEQQALSLAILGHIDQPGLDRLADRGEMDRLAIDPDGAAGAPGKADDRLHHGRAPRPDQPGKAENFALAQRKAHAPDAL